MYRLSSLSIIKKARSQNSDLFFKYNMKIITLNLADLLIDTTYPEKMLTFILKTSKISTFSIRFIMKVTKDQRYIMFGLKIVGDFGMTIAVPVVLFAFIGNRLDLKYGTEPWLTILGFVLAAVITARVIYTKAKRYGKEFDSIDQNKEEVNEKDIEDLKK